MTETILEKYNKLERMSVGGGGEGQKFGCAGSIVLAPVFVWD
jgi:hypothetical protein